MGFAHAGRSEEEHVFGVALILTGRQLEDLLAADRGIELPVEVFEALQAAEVGGFGSAGQHPLVAHVEFILEDEFEEFAVPEPGGSSFLQAHENVSVLTIDTGAVEKGSI